MNLLPHINRITSATGKVSSILLLLLLLNVFHDVIMRHLFNDVSIGMQELEWHLYATVFLLGISYTLSQDGHVRVDLFYSQLSARYQAMVDIAGTLLLLIPFALLIAWFGVGFAIDSFQLGEGSGDPGGLPHRWIIKSMIPLSFLLVVISGIGFMLRAWHKGIHKMEIDS